MLKLEELLQKVQQINRDFETIITETIMENDNLFIDANNSQNFAGQLGDGSENPESYAQLTINLKKLKNQPFDRVTLKDTGSFYKKKYIEVDYNRGVITMDSWDSKTDKLVNKYGDIFGVAQQRLKPISAQLRPQFANKFKQRLKL